MSSNPAWTANDPRSSSTQSLVPSESNEQAQRRKLLCIYVHGFMGDTTSFQSFPAHVHNLLTVLLAETHVVHTKLYPRYRSKRNISFARDDFSKWLEPHEDWSTDVVLLGHSMGGLLCAEVVLKQPPPPGSRPLQHRVLGTINFDVPFLGMHPGVIKSGLASIFAPSPDKSKSPTSPTGGLSPVTSNDGLNFPPARSDTLWERQQDENFNPTFNNDVVLPVRKGWKSAWHFVNKHSSDLGVATKNLVTSHMEFGGAMADYTGLRARYARIRALEEEDENLRKSVTGGNVTAPRVRFVNYYTASTGRPKKPKETSPTPSKRSLKVPDALNAEALNHALQEDGVISTSRSRSQSPSIKLEEVSDDGIIEKEPDVPEDEVEGDDEAGSDLNDMNHLHPQPVSDSDDYSDREDWHDAAEDDARAQEIDAQRENPPHIETDEAAHRSEKPSIASPTSAKSPISMQQSDSMSMLSLAASLPPVPDPPTAPPPLDVSYITDKDTKKLVEKEHARAMIAYQTAVKDREKIISDRAKLEKKRELKAKKNEERAEKQMLKSKEKAERDALKSNQKAKQDKAKQEEQEWKIERRETEKEMTQMEQEELRLQKERERMEAEARRMRGEKTPPEAERLTRTNTATTQHSMTSSYLNPASRTNTMDSVDSRSTKDGKGKEKERGPPKDRKFCMLPPKDSNGQRDPCWVRVFMKDVDEVGAHCGLFFVSDTYEKLVGDVAERIENWVTDSESARAVRHSKIEMT